MRPGLAAAGRGHACLLEQGRDFAQTVALGVEFPDALDRGTSMVLTHGTQKYSNLTLWIQGVSCLVKCKGRVGQTTGVPGCPRVSQGTSMAEGGPPSGTDGVTIAGESQDRGRGRGASGPP